jgi:hypothetical protein
MHTVVSSDDTLSVPAPHGSNRPTGRTGGATYLAQRQGYVKIGWSANIPQRVRWLNGRTMMPKPPGMDWREPAVLLGSVDGDHEIAWHDQWAHRRAGGEWFLPDAEMAAWIGSVLA